MKKKTAVLIIITGFLLIGITLNLEKTEADENEEIKYIEIPPNAPPIVSYVPSFQSLDGSVSVSEPPAVKEGWPQEIDWYYDPDQGVYYWLGINEPVVSDLDNDGKSEVITYVSGNPTKIYVYRENGTLFDGWPIEVDQVDLPGGNIRTPTVGDIDNDGYKEIIVNGLEYFYIYNHDGTLLRTIYSHGYSSNPSGEIVLFDLDDNGSIEIISKIWGPHDDGWGEQIAVFDTQGNILPGWPQLYYNIEDGNAYCFSDIESAPAVGNFDDDPEKEIVIAGIRNVRDPGLHYEGRIYVYNMNGSIIDGFPRDVDGKIFSSPAVGDVNNDGYDEIVVGTSKASQSQFNSGLYIIDRFGNNLSNWPQLVGNTMIASPALADFGQDGYLEIIQGIGHARTNDPYHTYIFDHLGNILPAWPKLKDNYDCRSSIIGNIDEDMIPDILTTRDKIYAWNLRGEPIECFPISWSGLAAATIADIDDDGMVELIASSVNSSTHKGYICVWEINTTYNSTTMQWPMFHHDPQHTGLFDTPVGNNNPPNPPTIDGPTSGKAGKEYNYTFNATDSDGDDVYYYIDWGDGNTTEWIGSYPSCEEVTVNHTWDEKGVYIIGAKAMDIHGAISEWGTLEVTMPHIFGYTISGIFSQNIKNKIAGSTFNMLDNGTAEYIIAHIQTNLSPPTKTKCMIYRFNDSKLTGTTEEKTLNTGDDGEWVIYNFSDPKPNLTTNTQYALVCWSNNTCNLYCDDASDDSYGRYKSHAYGVAPTPTISWDGNQSRLYSIYCGYSTVPEVKSVSASPNPAGFGHNIAITANVEHYGVLVDIINVSITYPNSTAVNFSMTPVDNDTFQYVFNDAWVVGQYNYSIWVVDDFGANCSSTNHNFNVSAQATISVCTIKDEYGNNETVNLTDPPGIDPPLIRYQLLDNGKVLHIWNKHNSYYFNTSSGIQLTNHYNEYWSHNVLMLGYHNNDEWNLIYRTDELSGFNKDIDTDNETFVNATLWKDLTYKGYDFRLAIRYHLGVNDSDLTIIPYIKNLGQAIPYVLGFGWEIKDIKIADTYENDSIRLYNGTDWIGYRLNQTLDNKYTDMDYNTTFYLEGRNEGKYFRRTLYLRWNHTLDYLVRVKSRTGQYNAPVTLFIKVGTLGQNQEKFTMMHWLDSDAWLGVGSSELAYACEYKVNLGCALDGIDLWSASTNHIHEFILDLGKNYSIKKFRGRSDYICDPTDVDIYISTDNSTWGTAVASDISTWQDTSTWVEVNSTDKQGQYIKVVIQATESGADHRLLWGLIPPGTIFDAYGDVVPTPPEISDPYPANGSTGISLTPTLNITVADAGGDTMNITWSSNSSGSWQVFGTNNSVGNGTYHQTFSNASVNGQWWYWKVNVTDGTNYTVSSVYKFYTGYQSKIKNTGSTSIKGYLLIQVQYYNTSTSTWVVADDTVNETSPRTINWDDPFGPGGQGILALDTVFNGLVNTSNLSEYGNGTYRIYAAFRDPDGNILVTNDETELEATYEFDITFD